MDGAVERARIGAGSLVLTAFTAAIFTSAFLLFSIQPMFTKMVLPQLGGSPAVWSIAMVVFQSLLLAGYGYAHLSTTRLSTRNSALLHIALLAITLIALPIGVSRALGDAPVQGQAMWLIGVFLLSVGLPFFAVAGNGPLLQAWFARSGHAQAQDPYFLYGASNLGSFAALLLYPVLFEPLLRLKVQSLSWSIGFGVLMVLIALSAFLIQAPAAAHDAAASRQNAGIAAEDDKPGLRAIAGWVALSFIPSGLLVAVTAHVSTDVAAAPFLWVVPLALFLLTFVLIFRDKPLLPMAGIARVLPILAGSLVLFSYFGTHMFVIVLLVHNGFFFVATLVCHHQLYQQRPAARHLTHFYLWMSVGGVLGGLFCGLIAPALFNRVLEYPILSVLAVAALPEVWRASRRQWLLQAAPILLAGLAAVVALKLLFAPGEEPGQFAYASFLIIAGLTVLLYRFPMIVMASLIGLFAVFDTFQHLQGGRSFERSFFGVHKIETHHGGEFRILSHGTTIHGAMRIRNADGTPFTGRPKPLTYYHPDGPIAEVLRAAPGADTGRTLGVVGLGAGAHACNGAEKDRWTYFEIDPLVVAIATDPQRFRFLSTCAPDARVIIGDARLTLAKEPLAYFDNLLIDAFSSDSIPVHLMTREALALYIERLKPDGLLTLHISNRHMELASVVAAIAADLKLSGALKYYQPESGEFNFEHAVATTVVVLARHPEALAAFTPQTGWTPLQDTGTPIWTDDFSNILSAIGRQFQIVAGHRWQEFKAKFGS